MQCLSAVFVVLWSTAPAHGAMLRAQKSGDLLAVVVRDVHIHEYGVANALSTFARQQRIVIGYDGMYDGIEMMGTQRTIQIDESTSTVADVLNRIVMQAQGYAWALNDSGAIHVYKINGRVSLVDVQPANFVIAEKDRREIWESLEHIPELISWLGDHRCTRGEILNGFEWRQNMKKVSLDTKGKSLRRIFDDVAGVTETYFWHVFQYPSNGKCVVGIYLW